MADVARGERLRQLREGRHLSQETAAHELGVSVKSIRSWEKGSGIKWRNAKRAAEFFGVDPESLVTREPASDTPDLMAALSASSGESDLAERLEWIESALEALLAERGLELDAPPSAQDLPPQTGSSGEATSN